jgi:transcriptional regulator with PAS, ATPase and Fis domain
MIYPHHGVSPILHPTVFVAPSADVIGEVLIGKQSAMIERLQHELDLERNRHKITSDERDQFAAIIGRDRARIDAETAGYAAEAARYLERRGAMPDDSE